MPLTAAQICTLAAQDAKVPGMVSQAGQFLNATLQDLCMNYDLDQCRGLFTFNFNSATGNGSGPYSLPSDYLRTEVQDGKDLFYYVINGVPYPLIQETLAEYKWQVQTPGFQSYPYNYATDTSQSPPQLFVWPPASGSYNSFLSYFRLMPDILTPETSSVTPWFPNTMILQRSVAGRLMGLSNDSRQADYLGDDPDRFPLGAGTLLKAWLKNAFDREGAVQTVGLDRRRFGRAFDRLKNTKQIGWVVLLALLLSVGAGHAQTGSPQTPTSLNNEVNTLFADNTIGAITPFNARQMYLDMVASAGNTLAANSWTLPQTFNGGIAGSGPVGMINTTTPASFTTPAYSFIDLGIVGFNFADASTHFSATITGSSPATGTGSYTGLAVTEFGSGRTASGFVTAVLGNATATGGNGNFTGINGQTVVCGTAVIAGQCPNGTAATLTSAVGAEFDIFSFTGATMLYKEGIRIADQGVTQASGAGNLSAGIAIARTSTAPGFVYGLYFGDPTLGDAAFPLTTTGSVIKLSTTVRAIDSIIDGSGLAGGITNGAMRLPENATAISWPSWSLQETAALVAFQIGGVNAALFEATASFFSGTLQSGRAGVNAGALLLLGSGTGTVTIQPGNAAAGTFNFNLPVTAGSAGNVLVSGGGGASPMTWINGVSTVCTETVGNTLTFTNGVLTTKGANCT